MEPIQIIIEGLCPQEWALWCLSTLSFKLQHIFIENSSKADLLGGLSPFKSALSAWWLNVVVFQATAKPSGQGTANDDDPGRHAVLTPVQDVPYENGSCQRGQETGSNVQIARPREVGVWSDAVESHQSDNQNKTCKENVRVISTVLFSWISVVARCHRPASWVCKAFPSLLLCAYMFLKAYLGMMMYAKTGCLKQSLNVRFKSVHSDFSFLFHT